MTNFAILRRVRPVVMLVLAGMVGNVQAQATDEDDASEVFRLDKQLFYSVYQIENPAFGRVMRVADATAYPMFLGGAASAWIGVWAVRGGDDWSDAYRLTVSEFGALGATLGVKYLARRTRPYKRFDDVTTRTGDIARRDPYSFPSGHAALVFAMATSWTLSHPKWYVAAPGYVWATSVALSRVWLGVHYPSDILVGAFFGSAVAWVVHKLGSSITPAIFQKDERRPAMPVIHLRVPLPK